MPKETIVVTAFVPAPPREVYRAWLSGGGPRSKNGARASCDPRVGGAFTARNGYIAGVHRALVEGRRIQQTWRTSDFPAGAEDSLVDVRLDPEGAGTRLTLTHSAIPEGQGEDCEKIWHDLYLEPMRRHFTARAAPDRRPPRSAAPGAGSPAAKSKATTGRRAKRKGEAKRKRETGKPRER
jgi:activator of HSP90 ATPase